MATKCHRSAVAALALLAVLSTLHPAILDEHAYEYDDVDYYFHRRLKVGLNPLSCSAAPRPACDGVLVTSQGGVGSSAFLIALGRAVRDGHTNGVCTNDDRDFDGFKHLLAGGYAHNATGVVRPAKGSGRETCFGKVLVVVGDPVHTIESTYRRFGMEHLNKLREAQGLAAYPRRFQMPLAALYAGIAASGRDETGITAYVDGWAEASRDPAAWPEVRLVTVRTLYDHAAAHAAWLGVGEAGRRAFARLRYDAGRARAAGATPGDAGVRERVREALRNVTEAVRLVERLPPPEPAAA